MTGFTENRKEDSGILVKAEAYTLSSVVDLDAFVTPDLPNIEVHLSNFKKQGTFRPISNVSKAENGIIYGFGSRSTKNALDAMRGLIHKPS